MSYYTALTKRKQTLAVTPKTAEQAVPTGLREGPKIERLVGDIQAKT